MTLEYYRAVKCNVIKDGEMKQISVDGTDVLIAQIDGKYYAVGAYCTHYGAPLAKGALCGKHVICPWHHAWFDLTNGDLLEPPALDALPNYEVEIRDETIYVALPSERTDRRLPSISGCDPQKDQRVFAIIGGGAAGYAAVQTLREDGYRGRIVMITKEDDRPYDRPNLSKDYLEGELPAEDLPLRPETFFKTHQIELIKNKKVKEVDHKNKKIIFEDGEPLDYDKALVATGGIPRKLDVPGADLDGVFILRSLDSANTIIDTVKNVKNMVIIGASFIGMEAAASLQQRGIQVTVIAPDDVPFAKTLGKEVGSYFKNLHQKNGVQFKLGSNVKAFQGDGHVRTVVLESGEMITTDAVLVGIGVKPATAILKNIELQKDGGVLTDPYLNIAPDFFAAGDIATVPDVHTQKPVRIEHWRYALQLGRTAAHNMAGKKTIFDDVPFFWTAHFGISLRYLGHAQDWDDIHIDGEIDNEKFLAFYIKNDKVTAVAGIGRDTEMAHIEQLFKDHKMPSGSEVKTKNLQNVMGNFMEQ